MAVRGRSHAADALSRAGLVLARRRSRHRGVVLAALVVVSFAAGAAGGYVGGWQQSRIELAEAGALPDEQALRQRLDQSELTLRVARSRGTELERQIDALNQSLHQCREELTFFRKAREDKRP